MPSIPMLSGWLLGRERPSRVSAGAYTAFSRNSMSLLPTAKVYSMTHEDEWFLGIVDEFSVQPPPFHDRRIRVEDVTFIFTGSHSGCSRTFVFSSKVEHHRSGVRCGRCRKHGSQPMPHPRHCVFWKTTWRLAG